MVCSLWRNSRRLRAQGLHGARRQLVGEREDVLDMAFLFASSAQRGAGVGKQLFARAAAEARALGARRRYVSATNTVR
jgi:predicted N-acetyltransferase YhbS